jgi:hypothetical protein
MDDFSRLFKAYRDAVPEPEPSANFMPALWRRIDECRSSLFLLKRFTHILVTVAAVVILLIGAVLIPQLQNSFISSVTYMDVLAAAQSSTESAAYSEGIHPESSADLPKR